MLRRALEASREGRARVVLVRGEPGIGKTCLLHSLAASAEREGVLVVRGGASEAEGMPPYLPFLEAFGAYIQVASPDVLRSQIGRTASVLAAILPEIPVRLGGLSPSYSLPIEQARFRLYEAVADFLAAIAAAQPVVLLLDDLQWIDSASLDLLAHIMRHQPSAPVLIIGAYREEGTDANRALERTIAELNRLRALDLLTVGPLALDDIADLASHALDTPVDPALSHLLFSQSEGNPFFAEELIRGWLEADALVQSDSGWTLRTTSVPTLPPGVAGAIRVRLERLPSETREILRTAAIIGRRFDPTLLAEAAGQEPEDVELQVRRAAMADLVHPEGEDHFAFSHDRIRECLYQEMTAVRRRRVHGFIGRALEARTGPPSAGRLTDLAFHFAHSGDRDRGAGYAQLAAEHALHTYAFEDALSHYRTALDLAGPGDARRGDLLLSLGDAAILAGAEREGAEALASARSWFREAGEHMKVGRAAHRLGQAWWRQERIAEAQEAFLDALALLEASPGPELVQLLIDLGTLLAVSVNRQAEGMEYVRRAVEVAERQRDERLMAAANRALGNLLVRSNKLDAGISLLERALALAVTLGDPVEITETSACLAPAYFWRGALRQSRDVAARRLDFARASHDLYQLRHAYTWLAMLASMQGRLDDADRLLDEAQPIVRHLASPEPLAWLEFGRGALACLRGDYHAARESMQRAISIFRDMGPATLAWYLGYHCIVEAHARPGQAAIVMDEMEALLSHVPEGTMAEAEPLSCLTRAALVLGDHSRCERYYPRLLAYEGQYHDMVVDCLLGEIEIMRGDLRAALVHLTAAEEMARREGLVWELALAREAQAHLTLATDGRSGTARARDLLEESREIHHRLGNLNQARRLDERLAPLTASRPRHPAGLTVREVEVLRLVTAGKSNRQIAAELVLSEKTVENHLTSIYTKAAVDNRAAASAFAVRHGLA